MSDDNRQKLFELFADVLLLPVEDIHVGLEREGTPTWDSLAVVSIAVGVEEVFGYHMPPEQAIALASVGQLMDILRAHGVDALG